MEIVIYAIVFLILGALVSGIVIYVLLSKKNQTLSEGLAVAEMKLSKSEERCGEIKSDYEGRMEELKRLSEARVAEIKEQNEKELKRRDEQFATSLNLAREQMKGQFEEETKRRSEQLKIENAERMQTVVEPLQKELEGLRKLVADTKEKSDKSTSALEESIKMVLMHDKERDKTTQDLAEALKNRGKVHGDWGEHVLTDILRDSGLREGIEYEYQSNFKNDNGADLRPDVIVKAPDGSAIIIDSKVSLTAYANYVGAESDSEREQAIKDNHNSVWQHVLELEGKGYTKVVDNSLPYVLMFVPNEGSYLLALNKDKALLQKAYAKRIVIVNPTNLMMSLQLILLAWQNSRQDENCAKILEEAGNLYDKFATFVESYIKIGTHIKNADNAYQSALGQLRDGKGNLSRRIDNLTQLGIKYKKRITPAVLPNVVSDETKEIDEN